MKNVFTSIIALVCVVTTGLSQDCNAFYPFEMGTKFEITHYNKRDKVIAVTENYITNVTNSPTATIASISSQVKDKDNDIITQAVFDAHCNNNNVSIDLQSLINPTMIDQFDTMETQITGNQVVIPNNLSVGQNLQDASMNIQVDMSGITMNMSISMTDRKVVGQETITTPAGTFDCYVITYTTTTEMGVPITGTAKQWLAKGVGMVLQEDYKNNGNLKGKTVLTKFAIE